MVFETLYASEQHGELLLWHGAMCRYHLRKDGQLTLHELIVDRYSRRRGIGTRIIEHLICTTGALCILARCPADLPGAPAFYESLGFIQEGTETTKTGRTIYVYRKQCYTSIRTAEMTVL